MKWPSPLELSLNFTWSDILRPPWRLFLEQSMQGISQEAKGDLKRLSVFSRRSCKFISCLQNITKGGSLGESGHSCLGETSKWVSPPPWRLIDITSLSCIWYFKYPTVTQFRLSLCYVPLCYKTFKREDWTNPTELVSRTSRIWLATVGKSIVD